MLPIDKSSSKPIYEQIIDGVEKCVLLGVYPPGTALPSQREMSAMLGINPNTIQKSYGELMRRGVIIPAMGSGSYVAPDAVEKIAAAALGRLDALKETVADLALAHVPREAVIAAIHEVYDQHTPPARSPQDPGEGTTPPTRGGNPS